MIKIGDGPHYVSESKEVQREDEPNLSHQPSRPARTKQMPRHLLAEVDANSRTNKKPVSQTDNWLEKHFGSTSSLSVSSNEVSRPGSREGYGLRRAASICDIRPVETSSNDFYATVRTLVTNKIHKALSFQVRKSGKGPEVKMREKKQEGSSYAARRVSANFSSSGHPVRPPRRTKDTTYEQVSVTGSIKQPGNDYGSLKQNNLKSNRSQSAHVVEKYLFGNQVTVRKTQPAPQQTSNLQRSYSSVQNLPKAVKPNYQSTENLSRENNMKKEQRSSISSRHRAGDVYQVKNRSGDYYASTQSQRKPPMREDGRNYSGEFNEGPVVSNQSKGYIGQTTKDPQHKIVHTTDTKDTKYRTKIIINGEE